MNSIGVHHLGKSYRLGLEAQRAESFREALTNLARWPVDRFKALGEHGTEADTFWALRDVSFSAEPGEVIGLIGRNGAGKSTLLKVLSRITEPTTGVVKLRGRVASLLEVGTGFHPELSGRENIYLNGAILGMRRAEIRARFDEIVAFAEVERFLDTPVKRYSSGMYVRLAFAVAAHLEPDILIVDEVLAVGDAEFQKKCMGKMNEVAAGQGRTVLFVSHNMSSVQRLCTRGILLRQGRLCADGPIHDVVREYLGALSRGAETAFSDNPERSGNGAMRITGARILDERGQPTRRLVAGTPITIELDYENAKNVSKPNVFIDVINHLGIQATRLEMLLLDYFPTDLGRRGVIRCRVPRVPFPPGQYRLQTCVFADSQAADVIPNAMVIDVDSSVFYSGHRTPTVSAATVMVDHEWSHQPAPDTAEALAMPGGATAGSPADAEGPPDLAAGAGAERSRQVMTAAESISQ